MQKRVDLGPFCFLFGCLFKWSTNHPNLLMEYKYIIFNYHEVSSYVYFDIFISSTSYNRKLFCIVLMLSVMWSNWILEAEMEMSPTSASFESPQLLWAASPRMGRGTAQLGGGTQHTSLRQREAAQQSMTKIESLYIFCIALAASCITVHLLKRINLKSPRLTNILLRPRFRDLSN